MYTCVEIFRTNLTIKWLNEPPSWKEHNNTITVTSTENTDFWRTTHYGFITDSGHFYYQQVRDFIVKVKVSGEYQNLYDQAGLMVRLNESNWLKCGIELVDEVQQVSAVVTRDYSDWSVVSMASNPTSIWLKVSRKSSAIEIHYSYDRDNYTMLRMAYFLPVETVDVGIMCASPKGRGFRTTFERFEI